jgi:hypothetical protein
MRTAAGQEVGAPPEVGKVQVKSQPRGDPPSPPYLAHQLQTGPDLRIVGSWESPEKLVAGVPAIIHVSWQAEQPVETAGLRFRLKATADDGGVLWEQSADPVAPLPERWPAGQVYRLTHRLQPSMPAPGTTNASLELCAGRSEAELTCAQIGRPLVLSRTPVFKLPTSPQQPVGARWDDTMTLAGYDLASAGQAITVTLYWRVDSPAANPLKRFVHVADFGGQIIAQSDVPLESEGIPAAYWRSGEYIVDQVVLNIPGGTKASELRLGLYDAKTEDRLPAYSPSGDPLPERQFTIPMP